MPADVRSREASAAISYLYTVAHNHEEAPQIMLALVEWTHNTFRHWEDATVDDVILHLYRTDCSATHAPPGLIFNRDLWKLACRWAPEIDAALYDYEETVGEAWKPQGSLTVGYLVWFAVEYWAHNLGARLDDHKEEILKAVQRCQET